MERKNDQKIAQENSSPGSLTVDDYNVASENEQHLKNTVSYQVDEDLRLETNNENDNALTETEGSPVNLQLTGKSSPS